MAGEQRRKKTEVPLDLQRESKLDPFLPGNQDLVLIEIIRLHWSDGGQEEKGSPDHVKRKTQLGEGVKGGEWEARTLSKRERGRD